MSSSKKMMLAFFLNLGFALIEGVFGFLFNSSAVLADAVHDLGDALAIGTAAFLERFSHRKADLRYSLGYKRFSLLGAMVTSAILISGSSLILVENIPKLWAPEPVNHRGMLLLGILAILINLAASFIVRKGQTRNEAILSLHFLEDILGWLAVILVSILLEFTDWYFLDPLLSLVIAGFILSKALPQAYSTLKIFLEAVPEGIDLHQLRQQVSQLETVDQVYQINVWTMDGLNHYASIHIRPKADVQEAFCKKAIRQIFENQSIYQVTIEIDWSEAEHLAHDKERPQSANHSHHHH